MASLVEETLRQGLRRHQAGELAEAERHYRKVLGRDPRNADALHLLGMLHFQRGDPERAAAEVERAVRLAPGVAAFHNNLGVIRQSLGKLDQALASYQRAAGLKPDYADARVNLAALLEECGRLEEAEAAAREAVASGLPCPRAHLILGNCLRRRGQPEAALASYQEAVRQKPDYTEAHNNVGAMLVRLGREELAVGSFREALRLRGDYGEAWRNLGTALRACGLPSEALDAYREALRHNPDDAEAHLNLSFTLLLVGRFQEGWREFEWRWRSGAVPERTLEAPLWDGGPLAGKTILVHAEQGFGDTIQFVRYARLLKDQGATVIVECQPTLVALVRTAPGVDAVVAAGDRLPEFDVHAPLLSLPRLCGTEAGNIPGEIPYLTVDPSAAEIWRRRIGCGDRFRVGIVWAGNPSHLNDRNRSARLADFAPLFSLPGTAFFSLQKGPQAAELAAAGGAENLVDLGGEIRDFMDTAAAMQNLDLLISVDTAAAHLAGALGKPVWMLVPFAPDWRWMLGREDSPWYPTLRLFRQSRPRDWADVMRRVRHQLAGLAGGQPAPAGQAAAGPVPWSGPADEAVRRKHVIRRRETDIERWKDPGQLDPAWDRRAMLAADFIPAGAVVLDLGCGAMALERFLPPGCRYLPCDLVARDLRTVVCDFNRGELPEFGQATHITALGLLEYVYELGPFLRALRAAGLPVVASYSPADRTAHLDRTALGWVNHLSQAQLAELIAEAGFCTQTAAPIDSTQLLLRLVPATGGPREQGSKVLVLSYNNLGNFGDRLGFHLVHQVLPASAVVTHAHFHPWDAPEGPYDLVIVGAGNSLYPSLLSRELSGLLDQARHAVGIFGTQYRHSIEPARLAPVLDRLEIWYARYEEDLRLYGNGRANAVHLGDWLIDLFPMAEPSRPELLVIGDEIWQDLPLDRTIQRIQSHRRVLSTRVHPLLCALTSAREVAYREQREDGSGRPSGKFRSMLVDVFGREFPEEEFFEVDRQAVVRYKQYVRRGLDEMRRRLAGILESCAPAPPQIAQNRKTDTDMPNDG